MTMDWNSGMAARVVDEVCSDLLSDHGNIWNARTVAMLHRGAVSFECTVRRRLGNIILENGAAVACPLMLRRKLLVFYKL